MPFENFSIHSLFFDDAVKEIESHFKLPPQAAISLAATAQDLKAIFLGSKFRGK